jgi:trigger factor
MKINVERLPKKGVKLTIEIEAERVKETYDHVVEEMVRNAEVKGFRKGEAPKSIVEPTLDPSKIRGEVVNHLIPQSYDQAVKESHIKPILLPKVELGNFEIGKNLQFTATTCEAPEINLGNYKDKLEGLKTEAKTILGADGQPISGTKEGQETEEKKIDAVIKALLETANIEICDLIIEEEVNHMLSRLVDQTGRLGLTVDQYLVSIGKDVESLKKEYRETAEKTLKMEFALMEAAKTEGITVSDSEIEAAINAAPDEESKKNLFNPDNRAYIKSILLKNKTIQKLLEYTK